MTSPSPGPHVFAGAWSHLEEIVERFESAWAQGQRPSIDEYVRAGGVERSVILLELAHTELECRLKAGEAVRVEEYFGRFPELLTDRERALELIAAEYQLRCRREGNLDQSEYLGRFPRFREDLSSRLSKPSAKHPTIPGCPRCQAPLRNLPGPNGEQTCPSCGFSFRVDARHPQVGPKEPMTRVGRFVLEDVAGRGAFGTVYRAKDTDLERTVAIKIPRGDVWGDGADAERFFREARNAARLNHPGIVPVHEVGNESGCPYLVSAFVEGETLATLLSRRRLGFHEAVEITAQVAEALEHAHQAGIVHRDIKPSNVLLGRLAGSEPETQADEPGAQALRLKGTQGPQAFVTDFGLARRTQAEVVITLEGQVLGTPAYMSPEQASGQGHAVDGRSDVYSLGVLFYELLTGELPFRGMTRMLLHQIQYEDPRAPRLINDRIPRDLETICLHCLHKEPPARYGRAGLLAEDLRRWQRGEPVRARPTGRWEQAWRWAKRHPQVAILSSLVALLLPVGAVGATVAAVALGLERDRTLEALSKAQEEEEKARVAREKAETNAAEARRQTELSYDSLRLLAGETQRQTEHHPNLQALRIVLLENALRGLQRVAQGSASPESRQLSAQVHWQMGQIYQALGRSDQSKEAYRKTLQIAQEASVSDPQNLWSHHERIQALKGLADIALVQGRTVEALQLYDEAFVATEAAPEEGLGLEDRMRVHTARARALLQKGDVALARKEFERGSELAQARLATRSEAQGLLDAAYPESRLIELCLRLGDLKAARVHADRAMQHIEAAVALNPPDSEGRYLKGMTLTSGGEVREKLGDVEARTNYGQAVATLESLTADDPHNARVRRELARARERLGVWHFRKGEVGLAEEQFRRVSVLMEGLVALDPASRQAAQDASLAAQRLAEANLNLGRLDEARAAYAQILPLRERLAREDPEDAQAQVRVAETLGASAYVSLLQRDYEEATARWNRARTLLQDLNAQGKITGQPAYQRMLKVIEDRLAVCHRALKAGDDLAYVQAQPTPLRWHLLFERSGTLAFRGRFDEAEGAIEVLRGSAAPTEAGHQINLALAYGFLTGAVTRGKPAPEWTLEEKQRRTRYAKATLAALRAAADLGFGEVRLFENLADLNSVRQEKEFVDVLERMRDNARGAAAASRGRWTLPRLIRW